MISLIFIPFLFWIYSKPIVEELNYRVIDLGLPFKPKKGEKAPEYAVIPIEGYNYKTIKVPSNFNEKIETEFINQVKKLQKENIDKTGIKFQLSDKNSYNDFVKLLNIMHKTKQDMYGLDTESENSLYVVHRKFEKSDNFEDFVLCGGVIYDYENQDDSFYQNFNAFQKVIKNSPKEVYLLIVGFLILVWMSINRLKKINKKPLQIT